MIVYGVTLVMFAINLAFNGLFFPIPYSSGNSVENIDLIHKCVIPTRWHEKNKINIKYIILYGRDMYRERIKRERGRERLTWKWYSVQIYNILHTYLHILKREIVNSPVIFMVCTSIILYFKHIFPSNVLIAGIYSAAASKIH